jgi:hypothetical protein
MHGSERGSDSDSAGGQLQGGEARHRLQGAPCLRRSADTAGAAAGEAWLQPGVMSRSPIRHTSLPCPTIEVQAMRLLLRQGPWLPPANRARRS